MANDHLHPATFPDRYDGPKWWPMSRLVDLRRSPGMRRLGLAVLLAYLLAILTGIMNVQFGWNGLHLSLGVAAIDVTIYPPLVLSVLAVVWIGPTWGIVPAYLANFVSAIWSGIPPGTSSLFAMAGAIETAILWGSMVTLNISPDLRRRRDVWLFVAVSIIAPVTSSLAVLIWNTSLGLDFGAGQRVWRGWVIGDFLELVLVVAPILRWLGGPARRWVDRQFAAPPRQQFTYTRSAAFATMVFALMGVLVFAGLGRLQESLDVPADMLTARGEPLQLRLFEIQLFLGLLVVALIVTTAIFATALARLSERQRTLARHDSLTGCYNRRAYYELFQVEADRSARLREGLSLVFADADHFKAVNDRHGHEVGDRVLRELAARLQETIRDTDLLFRWGGEEFVILLAHTPPAEAVVLADRVRAAVAARPFLDTPEPLVVTISIGTAGTLEYPADPDDLVGRADAACSRAKVKGRDRIESDGHTDLHAGRQPTSARSSIE